MTARSISLANPRHTPESQDLEARLLYIALQRTYLNLLLSAATATIGLALFWPLFDHDRLLIWYPNLLLMGVLGSALYFAYRRASPTANAVRKWRHLFVLHTCHAGGAWALGPVMMLGQANGMQAMLLVSAMLCVSAVIVNSISEQRTAMLTFISMALLPPAVVAWMAGGSESQVTALVLLMGFLTLALVGGNSHQTMRAVLETQMRMRSVLDNSLDAILGVDAEGKVTDWNRRAEAIFGWTRAEMLGLRIDETIIPPASREKHLAGMARFMDTGDLAMMQRRVGLRARRRNGDEFPAELVIAPSRHGDDWRFTCFVTDITEREAAETSLLVLSRAVEQSPVSIVITDPSGTIQYVNPKFEAITGYRRAEVIGRNPSVLSSGDKSAADYQGMWDTLLAGQTWQGEFHNRRKDGSLFWELASISPVFNDQGELIHFVGVKEDFTERKEIELALVEARETAERANRAKSDFLSSMSHELRTPMNAILGFAQVLDMDDRLHADQRDFVGEILKGGHHLLELINDVLELSRIESGKVHLSLEALELADVVDECRALILPLADARRLTLAVALPASATLRGDRVRLKQSLLNLLSNAVKYNREGGEIRLAATPAGAGRLRVTVSDSGHGIAPERMHELFQPFSRLGAEQGSIEGTGIGLNITRRLVELMGGKVGAESTPNLGSEFWIELPLADAPTAEAPRRPVPPAPSAPGPGESRGVLCIDDNPINLRLVARMLEIHRPLRLRTAHSATLGIELARAEPPDLILLDINMPGMDGFQALEILRGDARLRHVPVIAITANAMPRDIARGTAAGFDAYLTKPLNHALLVAEVDRFLAPATRASP